MAHVLADRVRETTSTTGTGAFTLTGTGAFTLTGAVSSFDTFDSALTVNGDTTWYCAEKGSQWEVGLGTRTSSTTLARTTVLSSSNSDGLVSFAAAPVIFITLPASAINTIQSNLSSKLTTVTLIGDTTNATPLILTIDGGAAGALNQFALANNQLSTFTAVITGKGSGSSPSVASFKLEGTVRRDASAGTVVVVGTVITTTINSSNTNSTYAATATADTTNGALAITIVGDSTNAMKWAAVITSTTVTF